MSEPITVGSVESGDILVTAKKNGGQEIKIDLKSKFLKQYQDEMMQIILETCKSENMSGLDLQINDQGALPAVIRARIKAVGQKFK